MVPKENSYLFTANRDYETTRINIHPQIHPHKKLKKQRTRELTIEDLEYYTAPPLWIKIRLCLFWSFWAAFFIVLIISIFMYCCIFPSLF